MQASAIDQDQCAKVQASAIDQDQCARMLDNAACQDQYFMVSAFTTDGGTQCQLPENVVWAYQ